MKNCLMVSIVFFDSEQLLTYNQPSKNASKYPKLACAKIAILHSTDFGGLIRPLNHIFLGLSMFGAHPQGLEGIYIQVSLWVVGEVFLEKCKKPEGGGAMKLGLNRFFCFSVEPDLDFSLKPSTDQGEDNDISVSPIGSSVLQ